METTATESKAMMMPTPQEEHQWLQKFVGEWTFEGEMTMEPGKPPMKHEGTESVRSIGGLWIVGEGQGEMPEGGHGTWIMTVGYDPQKQQFVGTFIGSMMTNLWVYEGDYDPDDNVLTLNAEGPNMMAPGKMAKFQDITEFESDDHRILTSRMQGEDGEWHEFMYGDYWRK